MSELTDYIDKRLEDMAAELLDIALEHEINGHPVYVGNCVTCKDLADLTYVPTPKPFQGA